jgi:hypothetical protein
MWEDDESYTNWREKKNIMNDNNTLP